MIFFGGGTAMTIRKYIPGAVFDPRTISVMDASFEAARTILNLDNPDDPLVEVLAKKIISVASEGVRDPDEICRRVVADSERQARLSG